MKLKNVKSMERKTGVTQGSRVAIQRLQLTPRQRAIDQPGVGTRDVYLHPLRFFWP